MSRKCMVITGAGSGIGMFCAAYFRDRGWDVVGVDVRDMQAVEGIRRVIGDVSVEQTAVDAVRTALDSFGRLDLLVNNAAISRAVSGPPSDLTLDEWNRVIGVNLTGPFLMAKHAAPELAKHRGLIVNIASTRALMSEPHGEAYAASKGGVVALTHAMANSLGPAVRVNCISPGWICTNPDAPLSVTDHAQHPAGRVGEPRDIALAIEYLDAATFVTGQNLVVDGGMTKKMIYAE